MIPRDRNRVPFRDLVAAVGENVGDQPQGLRGRVDIGATRDVFLEHVVLNRPVERSCGDPLLLGHQLVEHQQDRGGGVDRHGGGNLVEGNLLKEHPHVFNRVDGHPDLAHLAVRQGVVGVIAHLGGQIEGDGQASGSCSEQLPVALIGFSRGPKARVLPHRPGPAGVHRRVDPAGVRKLPRLTQRNGRLPVRQRLWSIDGLERESGFSFASHGRNPRTFDRPAEALNEPPASVVTDPTFAAHAYRERNRPQRSILSS